ncbi:hypothetical protein ILT44_29855 [Microvirga sp. BT689]|uniref:SAM domain-containing protein n=1 Tax=Microvirga arvi TaxID=2778731 RepID=UPI00194FAC92|nr:SAM domain-containing protein [Microvirga arvi]MBM6584402.1 hypothetical protein [Microvirga arvi]
MDIGAWLRSLGLEQYEAVFLAHAIDPEVLLDLSELDLEKLGVLLGHRKKLLKAIAALPAALSSQMPPHPALKKVVPDAERRQLTVMFCDLVGSNWQAAWIWKICARSLRPTRPASVPK